MQNEGGPLPEEAVHLVALGLTEHHQPRQAVWVLVLHDIYGREQDGKQLGTTDLQLGTAQWAPLVGASGRGEATKTGANQ